MTLLCGEVIKDDRGMPIKINIPNGPRHLAVVCQKEKGHQGPHLFKYGGFYSTALPSPASVQVQWIENEEDEEEAMRRFR